MVYVILRISAPNVPSIGAVNSHHCQFRARSLQFPTLHWIQAVFSVLFQGQSYLKPEGICKDTSLLLSQCLVIGKG